LIASELSPADKKKVGAIIGNHKTGKIIAQGYNKMFDSLNTQVCEDDEDPSFSIPYVIHAEELAVINYFKSGKRANTDELTMYVSYAPCKDCAKLTAHMGIKRVVFLEKHEHKYHVGKYSPAAFLHRMAMETIEVLNVPNLEF
jgi:dCMP deaminase